ncbi:hypothetical protein [Paenibacillus sp. FSL H3-0333]|uniref:hypothetical protein n=1 Tax=Paenibacillus sp. FSL H3-0333 TaxID=2921373 RepID=UPI0030FB3456
MSTQPEGDKILPEKESYADTLLKQKATKRRRDGTLASIIGILSLFILLLLFMMIRSCDFSNSDYRPTKSIKDMTNKEYNDFMKWKEKEIQKEIDKSPAFK